MKNYHIMTIDAEDSVTLNEGIKLISALRDEVERSEAITIPLVWFVRFQRTWGEYLEIDSAAYFEGPVETAFDAYELAKAELLTMRDRGDEIGWHYHAYGYVHREDLSQDTRLEILRADLVACGLELRARHPEFDVRSFRFGWFFIPDYSLFQSLGRAGIRIDASVDPSREEGRRVAKFRSTYLAPITTTPRMLDGVCLVPFCKTSLIHDWSVVPHEVSWRSHDESAARDHRRRFMANLTEVARDLKATGGMFITYHPFRQDPDNAPSPEYGNAYP